ncbi:MAG: hypothetical protein JST01_00090 [Cyanobacteria bacterium SZAS TMP-1]|nr:hypothetical protein [Cyanobacteria bacterium SZAS TMP-1]
MKFNVQRGWHRKASALVTGSMIVGAPSSALAQGWNSHVPMAVSVPLNHAHNQSPASFSTPSVVSRAWNNPGTTAGFSVQHASAAAMMQAAQVQHTALNQRTMTWQGQQFLTALPHGNNQSFIHALPQYRNLANLAGTGLNLDLSSTTANIELSPGLLNGAGSISITVGGKSETFSAGAHVTPAEYVAIRQVLTGSQSLNLDSQGAATGGSFSINAVASSRISDLVVPAGVVAFDYAGGSKNQVFTGDILNYGTIYGVGTRGSGNTVSINARDITNESGGLISTKLPTTLISTLGGLFTGVNLSLNAIDDISNSGKIISSGSLSLNTLNGSIFNIAGNNSNLAPVMQANGNVSVSSGSGNLTNSGLIASAIGNINISTANVANNINICAAGGTFQALKGDINVRDASYISDANINMNGGDYLSKNLDLYSGAGMISGSIGQVTGALNTVAAADHIQVATATLKLGNNAISGDPTFVNTSGGIQIIGKNQFGEDVAIIASDKITASVDGQIIANGHNVTLISGAFIQPTTDGPGKVQGNSTTPPIVVGNATTSVTVNPGGGSGTATNIDLSNSKVLNVIDTSNTTGTAGNVTLVAYNGSVHLAPSSVVNTTAGASGQGGNVTIIAGDDAAGAINIGGINTGGGSAGGKGGAITLVTAIPTTSDAKPITFNTLGVITSGNSFVASPTTNQNATVTVNGDLVTSPMGQSKVAAGTAGADAGAITITAGSTIAAKNILAFGGGGAGGDSSTKTGGNGGNGAAINISTATGNIDISGQINASGGGGGGAGSDGSSGSAGGLGGNAGAISITMLGPSPLSISGGIFAAQGGNGGASNALGVGGGGASYGGGGGGGASATDGGAGGAGYYGGGGAIINAAGLGGGYSGGSAGGSGAQTGGLSAGGNGIGQSSTSTVSKGGLITASQQGGQGVDTGSDGQNIPTTSGGNDVSIVATALATLGGDIVGKNISITAPIGVTFQGNVVGTKSTTINVANGFIFQNDPSQTILTPSLNLNVGSVSAVNIGNSKAPLSTNAQTITLIGKAAGILMTDSASSTLFDSSGLTTLSTIILSMTTANNNLDIKGLPAGASSVDINVGANASTGGTVNFQQTGITLAQGGSTTITANNLTWTNAGTSALSIVADNASGAGGTIAVTTNLVNGVKAITVGNTAGALNFSAKAGDVKGGSISLIAAGADLSLDANSLQVGFIGSPTKGAGGSIVLNVATLKNAFVGNLILNANGVGSGNGGTISITTATSNAQSIGTGSGDIQLLAANGGSAGVNQIGGSISFINTGNGILTVDPTGLIVSAAVSGANLNGGSITLKSGTVQNSGAGPLTLNVDGTAAGNGGKISLTQTNTVSPAAVTLGPTGDFNLSAQSGTTGGNGGSVTFATQGDLKLTTEPSGKVIGKGLSVAIGPQSGSGNGGLLTLSGQHIINANSTVGASNPLIFDVSGIGSGSGGLIKVTQLDSNANLTIGKSAGQMQFIATNGATGITGGLVNVIIADDGSHAGKGKLVVDPTAISLMVSSKTNANINGGFIQLSAPAITAASSVSSKSPLIIDVSGIGNASGGTIIFQESNGDSNTVIGNKAGQFELLAASGKSGGNGGTINAIGGGNLTVNPTGLSVKAGSSGNGGHITLSASNASNIMDGKHGNLLVTAALSATAGSKGIIGGTIGLSSNSSNTFNVGLTTNNINGVKGGLSATGPNSSVNLTSNGTGGMTVQSAISTPESIIFNFGAVATGNININATVGGTKTNHIVIAPIGSNTGIADNIIGGNTGKLVTSASGDITITAKTDIRGLITVSKSATTIKQLQINSTQLAANTVIGDIYINGAIAPTSTLTINRLEAGNDLVVSTAGILRSKGFDGFGGGLRLAAGGSLSANANTLEINAAARYQSLGQKSNSHKLVVTSYNAQQANVNTPTTHAIVTPSASTGSLGIIDITEDSTSVNLSFNTSVVLSGTIGKTNTSVSILNTQKNSSVTGPIQILGKTVLVQTIDGDIGTTNPNGALHVSSQNLVVNAGPDGGVFVDNSAKSILGISNSSAGSFQITSSGGANITNVNSLSGDINITTLGTTTLNNLSSAGGVTVLAGGATTIGNISATGVGDNVNIKNTTGLLQTSTNAKITSQNGGIFLENANTKSGAILIGTGADIETGTSPATGLGGDIGITIGDLPTTPIIGTAPATIVTINQIGGTIYWGANSISGTAKTGSNIITAKNANVIFNTGNLKSSAIKLNGSSTIIADPPIELSPHSQSNSPDIIGMTRSASTEPRAVESISKMDETHPLPAEQLLSVNENKSILSLIPYISNTVNIMSFDSKIRNSVQSERTDLNAFGTLTGATELPSGTIPARLITIQNNSLPLDIRNGAFLIAAKAEFLLNTPLGTITLAPDSLALVLLTNDAFAVYDIDDKNSKSVLISTKAGNFYLRPGQLIQVGSQRSQCFDDVNLAQLIPVRRVKVRVSPTEAELVTFSGEFHLLHALTIIEPLKRLLISENRESREIAHLLKTICIISEGYSIGEPFHQPIRPRLFAASLLRTKEGESRHD